jgi:two-component system, OmpR family, response regulator
VTSDATTLLLWASQHRDVVVLRWPEQILDVERLEQLGVPRLLLVEPGVEAPDGDSCLQDWLRLPADDADVRVRLHALARRADSHAVLPTIDPYGQLSYRGRALFLSPLDQRIVSELIEHFDAVVMVDDLKNAWPEGTSTQALRVHISRLRHRVASLGLTITSIRNVGYVMRKDTQAA